MRSTLPVLSVVALSAALVAPLHAGTWNGTVKLGGVILDEEGDLSAVQETYNLHDGFSISQIRLHGTPDLENYFTVNLREINLDGRRGKLVYRRPGALKLAASFDQHRQVFDPERGITSERKDYKLNARFTPTKWLWLSGSLGDLKRDGDRLSFPAGTSSVLGTSYDYALRTGSIGAEARTGRRGVAVNYRISDFSDELNRGADRSGQVVSARLFGPCALYDKWTHLVRGSYGVSELDNGTSSSGDLDYRLYTLRYTGVVRPVDRFQFKYTFDAQRVDNASDDVKTDRFLNGIDATVYHPHGSVAGGYAYEIHDSDRRLTSNHSWRAAATFRHDDLFSAKVRYAGRVRTDTEELTLLKDVESSRMRADVEITPVAGLLLGGGYSVREREYPDIAVKSDGESFRATVRYSYAGWGALSGDYAHTNDEYTDRVAGFDAESDVVTGRLDFERIHRLRLSSGVTYVDVGQDLDIEKTIWFLESRYTVLDNWHVEAEYNIFSYDDFVIADRYYKGSVVRFNVVYDLQLE